MLKSSGLAIPLCLLVVVSCQAQPSAAPAVQNWAVPQYWAPSEVVGRRQPAAANAHADLSAASSAALTFVAVTPCRILDTRTSQGFTGVFGPPTLAASSARTIPIPNQTKCNIPSAPAYSLNFTVVPPGPLGFLSAWPDDATYPGTSVLNDPLGTIQANAAIVPGGADGGIQVVAGNPTDLIVDINGYFVSTATGSGLTLPFSGSSTAAGTTFSITNSSLQVAGDPTQSPAAIEGNGGDGHSFSTAPGNIGVAGVGGTGGGDAGLETTVTSPGGIGVLGMGGSATGSTNNNIEVPGNQGGAGVYAIGGSSSGGHPGGIGGVGVQAFGGTGGLGCGPNLQLSPSNCLMQSTDGGQGGFGVSATGGAGALGGAGGVGIYAAAGTPGTGGATSPAGMFQGNVQVVGTLSKSAGSFRIDHPQDPANKYLSHSFVESPDMMNIYDGNVVLDATGAAWVELPEWFEALNRDFRYQLTAIGSPAPGLFIAQEIVRNRFQVAGGHPGGKISWSVTGIRQDPYANAHRILIEEEKSPQERGTYLHPDLYGMPEERNVIYAQHPELLRNRKGNAAAEVGSSGAGSDH